MGTNRFSLDIGSSLAETGDLSSAFTGWADERWEWSSDEVDRMERCTWTKLCRCFCYSEGFSKGRNPGTVKNICLDMMGACSVGMQQDLALKKKMYMIDPWRSDPWAGQYRGRVLDYVCKGYRSEQKEKESPLGLQQNKLSVTALGAGGDSERKLLSLLITLMSYFNELSCHSVQLIVGNFPQSKKHDQLTLLFIRWQC